MNTYLIFGVEQFRLTLALIVRVVSQMKRGDWQKLRKEILMFLCLHQGCRFGSGWIRVFREGRIWIQFLLGGWIRINSNRIRLNRKKKLVL